MNKLTRIFVYTLLSSLSLAAAAQKPKNSIDASALFMELHANAPVPGSCGCFWMGGGTADLAIPIWRNFSAVAESQR